MTGETCHARLNRQPVPKLFFGIWGSSIKIKQRQQHRTQSAPFSFIAQKHSHSPGTAATPSLELTEIFLLVIWSIPLIIQQYLHNHVPVITPAKAFKNFYLTKYVHIPIHLELIFCLPATQHSHPMVLFSKREVKHILRHPFRLVPCKLIRTDVTMFLQQLHLYTLLYIYYIWQMKGF